MAFYLTPAHPCNYLPGREAQTLFADPAAAMSAALYSQLVRSGFRRSGQYVYRPHCEGCAACVPIRLPAADFMWRRTHRRTLARNAGVNVRVRPAAFDAAHFDLYTRYLAARHPGGGMDNPTPDKYLSFLTNAWAGTRFAEFRAGERLLMVAVVDPLRDGLSAVYTFYDPDLPDRSLGSLAILWQVLECQRLKQPHVYLGYWIEDCVKMTYKSRYTPHELLLHGRWQRAASPSSG